MIEIKNLHKSFDDKEVLKGITTRFESGKTQTITVLAQDYNKKNKRAIYFY